MFSISDDDDLDYLSGDFLDVPSPKNRPAKRSSFDLGLTDHNTNTKKPCITELNLASQHGKNGVQRTNSEGQDKQKGALTLHPPSFLRSNAATTPCSLPANAFTGLAGRPTSATCISVSKPNTPKPIVSSTFSNKPCGSVLSVSDKFTVPDSESRSTANDLDFGLDSDSDLDLSLVNAMVGAVETVDEKKQGAPLAPRNAVIHNSQVPSTSKVNFATVSNKGLNSNKPPSLSSNNMRGIDNQPGIVGGLRTPLNSVQPSLSSNAPSNCGKETASSLNISSSHRNESGGEGNLSKVLRTPSVQPHAPFEPSNSAGSCLRTPYVPVRLGSERYISPTPNPQHDTSSNAVRSSTSASGSYRLRTPDVLIQPDADKRVTATLSRGASNVHEQCTPSHQNPLFVRTKVSPLQTSSPCPREGRPEATTRYITPKCPAQGRMRTTDDATPRSRKKRRKFPGPAGMLPKLAPGQDLDNVSINPFDNAAKMKENSGQKTPAEDDSDPPASQMTQLPFGDEVWQCMKEDIGPEIYHFCRDFNIAHIIVKSSSKQLPRGKVPVMCAMVDSMNVLAAEASVILKDTSGEIKATVHRQVVKEFQSELQAGCGLVLKQVGVFSPSVRKHYLNITPNNLVYIYTKKDAQLSCQNISSITVGEIKESLILDQEAEHSRSTTAGMPQTPVQSHSVGPNHMRTPVAVVPHTPNGREQSQNRNSMRTAATPNSGLSTPTIAGRGSVGVRSPPCPTGIQPKTPRMPQAAMQGRGMGPSPNSRTSFASNPGLNTPTGVRRGSGQFQNSAQSSVGAAGGLSKHSSSGTPRPGPSQTIPTVSGLGGAGTLSGSSANSHQCPPQSSNVSTQNRSQGAGLRTPIPNQRLPNPGHMSQGPVRQNSNPSIPCRSQRNSMTPVCAAVPNNGKRKNSGQSMNNSGPSHSGGGNITFRKTSMPSAQIAHGNMTQAAMSTPGDKTSTAREKSVAGKSDAVNWENESISDLLCGLEDEMMDDLEV